MDACPRLRGPSFVRLIAIPDASVNAVAILAALPILWTPDVPVARHVVGGFEAAIGRSAAPPHGGRVRRSRRAKRTPSSRMFPGHRADWGEEGIVKARFPLAALG